ncbi:MAG: cydA [Gammaproteobacteria bacterium]|jgi:cytochrome d ubiquinol oxidase subunit I|nr:cydA [Gammaproteobacteria bacterium]
MLENLDVVTLSRIQFGLTAMYHFIFVPLTLGLSVILGIMETIYVMTGREIWKKMTQYWGILFGINFVMGVATGITMEFQFGTNWAYYAHYVGDVFGTPLAIEGFMAFFLEATFVGMFVFGWNRMSKVAHLTTTWMVALGSNLSALWILIANGWMQHPVGAHFNFQTLRMEVSNFGDVLFNPVGQAKFVHTVSAGYVTGATFVLAVSAYFLLRKRNSEFAIRSITVAASFGLAAALSAIVLGDESGYLAGENQKMKLAAVEGAWHTEAAPASFNLIGFPNQDTHETEGAIKIPYVLGLIATRSLDKPVMGIDDLVKENAFRIQDGIQAYSALRVLLKDPNDKVAQQQLSAHESNLGYSLLLKPYTNNIIDATPAQIQKAAEDTVPHVAPLFWTFRIMVACAFFFLALFAVAFYLSCKRTLEKKWFLVVAFCSLPLPWVASEMGWFVAENGRQPWAIDGVLPTFLGTSSLATTDLWISVSGFVVFYTLLAIVEVYLMIKYIRLGPENT